MSSGSNRAERPTGRQLAYLRSLAIRAGQTFTYPQTRRQASREIHRLKRAHEWSQIGPADGQPPGRGLVVCLSCN